MNIKNLKVGTTLKNYKELCRVLEVEPKKTGSNSYKSQIKEFNRYFSFKREGYRIIVTELYETPKDKIDNRVHGNNSIYTNIIQDLVIYLLLNKPKYHMNATISYFIVSLGISNNNYLFCKDKIDDLKEYTSINVRLINDFYSRINGNFRDIIETSFLSLYKKEIVNYKKIKMVRTVDNQYREATQIELDTISNIEKDLLKQMKCKNKYMLIHMGKKREFDILLEHILSETLSIRYSFFTYDLWLLDTTIEITNSTEKRTQLNQLICENIVSKAKTRHEETVTKYPNEDGIPKFENDWDKMKYFPLYFEKYEKLTKTLIALNANNIIPIIGAIKKKQQNQNKIK